MKTVKMHRQHLTLRATAGVRVNAYDWTLTQYELFYRDPKWERYSWSWDTYERWVLRRTD